MTKLWKLIYMDNTLDTFSHSVQSDISSCLFTDPIEVLMDKSDNSISSLNVCYLKKKSDYRV